MLYISNKGNLKGPIPELENSIPYIQDAIDQDFYVVVDVYIINDILFLGEKYQIDIFFIKQNCIICRTHDNKTFQFLLDNNIHCFYQDKDDTALTSQGYIFTHPLQHVSTRSIVNMPEWYTQNGMFITHLDCTGICSNQIKIIRDMRKNVKQEYKKISDQANIKITVEHDFIIAEEKEKIPCLNLY